MRRVKVKRIIGAALLVLVIAGHAVTATADEAGKPNNAMPWSVSLGALGTYGPAYEGSDDDEARVFPLIDIRWRNRVFLNARRGLGVNLLNEKNVTAGASVGYRFGRDEDDSDDLRGLGDIDGGATITAFIDGRFGDVSVGCSIEEQVTGANAGARIVLNGGYTVSLMEGFVITPSVTVTGMDSDYADHYFSVTAAQSAASGLPRYDASAGIVSLGPQLRAVYRLTDNWSVQGVVGAAWLVGDAADSPIVKDTGQVRLSGGVVYRF